MGTYVFKITGKKTTLKNGQKANIAVYAYKPYGFFSSNEATDRANKQMHRESGCYTADRYVRDSQGFTGLVVIGSYWKGEVSPNSRDPESALPWPRVRGGSFYDDSFDEMLYRHHNQQEGTTV
jgi:hypothetical protein